MSKQKDASTCDDRQVENKPKPLTKKKEGETRRMNSKSINHWKMAALFVVGLMAVAGVFSSDVLAQTATTTVHPTSVPSDDVVDVITVIYTVDTVADGSTALDTGLTVSLPTELTAAATAGFEAVAQSDAVKELKAPSSPRGKSYVTSSTGSLTKANDYAITVSDAGTVVFPSTAMRVTNRIVVRYHNVKVAQLGSSQLEDRDTDVEVDITATHSGTDTTATTNKTITLQHPKPSDIRVTPRDVWEKSTTDVTVTYQVKHDQLTNNDIVFTLPSTLPLTGTTFETALRAEGGGQTTLPTPAAMDTAGTTEADYQYVTITDTVTTDFETNGVSVTATGVVTMNMADAGEMELNEKITVIYHNVEIAPLATRTAVPQHIGVTDSAISPTNTTTTPSVYMSSTALSDKIKITTSATPLSRIKVSPSSVKTESTQDMTIRYTANHTVYSNNVTTALPSGWVPKFGGSFGSVALEAAPATGADTTSYVVVKKVLTLRLQREAYTLAASISSL